MREDSSWAFPASPPSRSQSARRVLGPLATLARDVTVTDIFVLGDGRVFADRGSGAVLVSDLRVAREETRELARALIEEGGRHLDEASPLVDVRLEDGVRVHAALPPVAVGGPTMSLRFPRHRSLTVDELNLGWSDQQRSRVLEAVDSRETILISGSTGSGKTTLLGALLSRVTPRERIVVLEDVAEISIDHPHVVHLECRQASIEAVGEITLDRLVRESLRMRPNRLVVGECRGAELRDLLAAFTSGHRGGATTIHAPSLKDLPARLETLGALAGLTPQQVSRHISSAFDLVIHLDHVAGQARSVDLGLCQLNKEERLVVTPL